MKGYNKTPSWSLGNYNQLLLLTQITFWLILLLGWSLGRGRKKLKNEKKYVEYNMRDKKQHMMKQIRPINRDLIH